MIQNENSDAAEPVTTNVAAPTSKEVFELLKVVIDPDIGVNIVDLGLIYDVDVQEDRHVNIEMTLTTPGCPYGPQLIQEVNCATNAHEGVKSVNVEIVWEPPWSMDYISEATRLEMGMDI